MGVADQGVKCLSGNGVVLAGSELGSKTVAKDGFSGNFSKDGNAQGHVCELEGVSNDVEVSSHEDGRDDRSVGDGGSSYGGLSV